MAQARKRPEGVPAGATWTPAKYWTHSDARRGIGRHWSSTGVVICEWSLGERGRVHGVMRKWYPTGQLESETPYVHGTVSGVQTLFAPRRGQARDFTLKSYPKIFSLKRTWVDGKPRKEECFDAEGRPIDAQGRLLREAGRAKKSVRQLSRKFKAKRGETFERALERASLWAQALREAGHDVPVDPRPKGGKPASAAAISRLERALGGSLPASYARFLRTVGAVKLGSFETVPPATISARAKGLQQALQTMVGDLRQTRPPPLPPTRWSQWRGAKSKSNYLPDDELLVKSWLTIAAIDHRVWAMAPHLELAGDAPIFELYTDEELCLSLVGNFDALVSQSVDEHIAEITHELG